MIWLTFEVTDALETHAVRRGLCNRVIERTVMFRACVFAVLLDSTETWAMSSSTFTVLRNAFRGLGNGRCKVVGLARVMYKVVDKVFVWPNVKPHQLEVALDHSA